MKMNVKPQILYFTAGILVALLIITQLAFNDNKEKNPKLRYKKKSFLINGIHLRYLIH